MRVPWANVLVLFWLLVLAVSGYFGFTNGRFPQRWLLWLHGLAAYALLVTLFWKGSVIADAWQRKKQWTARRRGFVLLLVLLLLTLLAGLLWSFNGPIYLGGFSLVSLHIYLALPLLGLLAWHSWHMRFVWRVPQAVGRRLFGQTAVSALLGLLLWRGADWAKRVAALPGARRRFTGSYEIGSLGGTFPTVSWIADRPPAIAAADWQLVVAGAVQRPFVLTYAQVVAREWEELTAVLDCTGGWYSEQRWQGLGLGQLLDEAGVVAEAASVTIRSATGYQRRFPLGQARSFLLATHVAAEHLSHGHGFPLRLVAAGERGVEWVKWVVAVEVNQTGASWQLPLPLQ
jgi:DMSO/TMAO reductase YedYZ molybdopterin-dependent catalytic subunit